jgi:uncharacterized protein YecT (DUF1311 family)
MAAPLLLLVTSARGDEQVDCKNAMTQMDMNYCAGQDFNAADAKLNATYKKLTSELDPHELDTLKVAQRAWVAWRDAECTYETIDSEGGSIRPMEISECQTELTNDRVKQLAKQVECPAGNLACPAN